MNQPATVVIPFAVPAESRGLGLGLAALVHAYVHVGDTGVALARLKSREGDGPGNEGAIEAFVAPSVWRGIARPSDGPRAEGIVLTGQLEPPVSGQGTLRLLAFNSDTGNACAQVDEPLDEPGAGASIVRALDALWTEIGGEIGALRKIRELGWEPLESVLRAEQSALFDPGIGGPHDRLAALIHLGRAISDAPQAEFPSQRMASLALDVLSRAPTPSIVEATHRALQRATEDAPSRIELVEALAMVNLRMGRPRQAELELQKAIELAPRKAELYSLLAQALRAQGNVRGALAAIDVGLGIDSDHAVLLAGRGELLAETGDIAGAMRTWSSVLVRDPVQPSAFGGLARTSLRTGDVSSAQTLVDSALQTPSASRDVLRYAVELALATEPEGTARAVRVATLCKRSLAMIRTDGWTLLVLAYAMRALGDLSAAAALVVELVQILPQSGPSAEAVLIGLAMQDPLAERELISVMRAVHTASPEDLDTLASRARRFAMFHGAWVGDVAVAVAARRQGRWMAARESLDRALIAAPGAASAHAELGLVLRMLDDDALADSHLRTKRILEAQSPASIPLIPRNIWEEGRRAESRVPPPTETITMKHSEHRIHRWIGRRPNR